MPICISTKRLEEKLAEYSSVDQDVAAALAELQRARAKLAQLTKKKGT